MSIADLKHQELPLARIKKIMKLDEDVKVSCFCWSWHGALFSSLKPTQMISAEAPVLFAKAAEMFIHELTMRAWIHIEVSYLITTSENSSTWLDQLIYIIMAGQQEEDPSEERHCYGHHQIRPVWLPHRHCAQVLYKDSMHLYLGNHDLVKYSANSHICYSEMTSSRPREESSVRMVPDQVSLKNKYEDYFRK